ncbi:DUF4407 domain-containing protein [Aquirufa ecclesiirivi]|uniref:DUF4407 domain-containing protein n=1 Tax=Aquirufa ecclesiirivi TaxID=2715124 RepID=UPI0022A888F2|nr:DUF4407 domain-containing protein [Aquirufa ecclesiirivi]MCZ2471393.1 DUF4407 domain-containing protein [Aquirufa ecclesiirivi]
MEKTFIPKDLWLRFGCFLSGHNYQILSECSEASKRDQKKITSALVIITLIWSIIGYIFSNKYLNFGPWLSLLGSAFMAVLIVQIERQIILSAKLNSWAKFFRVLLGIIVAVIGASIIDQYLFANDIQKIAQASVEAKALKESNIAKNVYQTAIAQLDSTIMVEKINYQKIQTQVLKLPATLAGGGGGKRFDAEGNLISEQQSSRIPNPEISNLRAFQASIASKISVLENEKIQKGQQYATEVKNKAKEILSRKPGFLDELNALINYLMEFDPYPTALIFYLIWFFFFLLIESLVLIIKSNHHENDYEKVIDYQQNIRIRRLMALEDKRNAALGADSMIGSTSHLIQNLPK